MTDAPWLDDTQQQVWRQWLDVTTRLPAALNRQLQEGSELSLSDFDVLVPLSEQDDGRLRIGALAERLQWERSRLSHHLSRMERRALVRREECLDDRRGWWVVLTAAGRRAIESAAPDHVRFVREVFIDLLDDDDLAVLGSITARIAERLDQA
jgi:DNA-binding MarR family transcriptional regulator